VWNEKERCNDLKKRNLLRFHRTCLHLDSIKYDKPSFTEANEFLIEELEVVTSYFCCPKYEV
jgi:hypothetical protein